MGSRHVFTTTVIRQTDRSPLVGWIVRYEIVGGPAAGFSPDGGQVFEAVDERRAARPAAEIFQQQPTPGTNMINVQLIRPAELSGSYGQRLVVGERHNQQVVEPGRCALAADDWALAGRWLGRPSATGSKSTTRPAYRPATSRSPIQLRQG